MPSSVFALVFTSCVALSLCNVSLTATKQQDLIKSQEKCGKVSEYFDEISPWVVFKWPQSAVRFFVYAVYISTSGSGKEHERGKDELRLHFFREITPPKKNTSPQFPGFARVACWRRNFKLSIVTSRSNFCNKTISGHFIKRPVTYT